MVTGDGWCRLPSSECVQGVYIVFTVSAVCRCATVRATNTSTAPPSGDARGIYVAFVFIEHRGGLIRDLTAYRSDVSWSQSSAVRDRDQSY